MWMDRDGVAHSVSLPDPSDVMSEHFRRALDTLVAAQGAQVREVVAAAEDAVFDLDLDVLLPAADDEFVAAAPPRSLLDEPVSTVDDLARALAQADLRWRLDLVHAVEDYVD